MEETDQARSAIRVRALRADDVARCGEIACAAHRDVAGRHNVPPEQPSVEFSTGLIAAKLADRNAVGLVAEDAKGELLGSGFLNYFPPSRVAAIGPLTAHPAAPGGTGRALLERLLAHDGVREHESIRLVQSPSHLRSLALYAKLGFVVREPLVLMQGELPKAGVHDSGAQVRPATLDDVDACMGLAESLHHVAREFELRQAIASDKAALVEHAGRLCGYAAGVGMRGHLVAESDAAAFELISSAPRWPGPGFFVPLRQAALLRGLLDAGMRMAWPAALMTRGRYADPLGAFLPSIAY